MLVQATNTGGMRSWIVKFGGSPGIEDNTHFRNNLFFLIKALEMQFIFETGLLYTLQDTALLLRRGQLLALDNQTPGIPVPIA